MCRIIGQLRPGFAICHFAYTFPLFSQSKFIACSQAVEFYLDEKYAKERETIIELVNLRKPLNDITAMNYIRDLQSQFLWGYGTFR